MMEDKLKREVSDYISLIIKFSWDNARYRVVGKGSNVHKSPAHPYIESTTVLSDKKYYQQNKDKILAKRRQQYKDSAKDIRALASRL